LALTRYWISCFGVIFIYKWSNFMAVVSYDCWAFPFE